MKFRSLDVFVDGKFVVDLAYGKTISKELSAGEHKVQITNRLHTRDLSVVVEPGGHVRVQVGNTMGGLGVLLLGIGLPLYKPFIELVEHAPTQAVGR